MGDFLGDFFFKKTHLVTLQFDMMTEQNTKKKKRNGGSPSFRTVACRRMWTNSFFSSRKKVLSLPILCHLQ
jgi:transposase-like protein